MFKTIVFKLLMPLLMGGLFLAWQLGGILGARNLLIALIAVLWLAVVYCLCLVATDKKRLLIHSSRPGGCCCYAAGCLAGWCC